MIIRDFFLSCLYGSPNKSVREFLWRNLVDFSNSIGRQEWVYAGDFKAFKSMPDKKGGVAPCFQSIEGVLIMYSGMQLGGFVSHLKI